MPTTKSTNFDSRYLGEGLWEEDIIVQVAREGGVDVHRDPDGAPWSRGSPWRTKILKGVKNFYNVFLQAGLTDLDEIWHDGVS